MAVSSPADAIGLCSSTEQVSTCVTQVHATHRAKKVSAYLGPALCTRTL